MDKHEHIQGRSKIGQLHTLADSSKFIFKDSRSQKQTETCTRLYQ